MKRLIAAIIIGIMLCVGAVACAPDMPQGNPKTQGIPEGLGGRTDDPVVDNAETIESDSPSQPDQRPSTPPAAPGQPDDSGE